MTDEGNLSADLEALVGAVDELISRQQIADVVRTAGRAGDRADLELLKDCYHEDAYEDHGYFQGSGWEFAEQALGLQVERYKSASHYLAEPLIELDGDRAFAETYVQAVMIGKDEEGRQALVFAGRYLDAFERRDGRWRIAQRITVNDHAMTQCLDGPRWPWGEDPVFVVGRQDSSDPVYLLGDPDRLREAPRG